MSTSGIMSKRGDAMAKLDLTDQRFGKLTVLHELEKVKYSRYWLCRCDCGKETRVLQGNLRRGLSNSCGCNRSNNGKIKDLTGQVFG